MPEVAIIMGSDSDMPKLKDCFTLLESFGVSFDVTVSSAHRTPEQTKEWAKTARERGVRVIIAAAGGAAHLPGVVAAFTTLPVLGVPIETSLMGGLDSVLSILQMPSGIPVAAMPVGKSGAANAALFAVSILASSDSGYAEKLGKYREDQSGKVIEKNEKLAKIGYREYLKGLENSK